MNTKKIKMIKNPIDLEIILNYYRLKPNQH